LRPRRWRARSRVFAAAPRTQYAGGRAKRMAQVNESWDLMIGPPSAAEWSAQETELAITLLRPSREELAELVEEEGFELEDESAFDESSWVWRAFVDGSRPIVSSGISRPSTLFGINMAVDHHFTSSSWTWKAVAVTRHLALLCESSDDFTLSAFPHPIGVITRAQKSASAALLLSVTGHGDPERFTDGSTFFSEVSAAGIPDAEV
jgi:hypothetical protein